MTAALNFFSASGSTSFNSSSAIKLYLSRIAVRMVLSRFARAWSTLSLLMRPFSLRALAPWQAARGRSFYIGRSLCAAWRHSLCDISRMSPPEGERPYNRRETRRGSSVEQLGRRRLARGGDIAIAKHYRVDVVRVPPERRLDRLVGGPHPGTYEFVADD